MLSISLLLAMLGLIGLAGLGCDVPILRQLVGFVFLTLVPGLLILRILKIHNINIIESLLYSAGLSLAFIMASGVVANFALPPLGIAHPISLLPLTITFTLLFLILCTVAYLRDKDFRPPKPLTKGRKEIANPSPWLLAVLLPLLAVLGAGLVNSYYHNSLLFVLIFLVIVIVGLVAFNRFIPPRVYPFMIFMMALALIYQTTLISSNLVGSDIHLEYYLGNIVTENGYWDAALRTPVNSCLSIVMLAPVYSLLLNMDTVWIFKAIYPLFFCLTPLALFHIFRLQIKPLYAFLAAFFFISMPMFMMDMAQLARQQVSELFFVLVILLLVDRRLTLIQRTTLALVFGFGVVVSHYGMGTAYIGYLLFGALVLVFIKSRPGRRLWQWLVGKPRSLPADLTSGGAFDNKALAIVVGASLVFMLGYYSVAAGGAALSGVRIATGTGQTAISGGLWFLNPLTKEPLAQTALGLDFLLASGWGKAWRIFQYLVEVCLIIGFFRLIFRPRSLDRFKAEYISLTIVSALALLGIFVLPTLYSSTMGTTRIFQITLLLMSPLFIFGGEAIGRGIGRILRKGFASSQLRPNSPVPLQFLVLAILIPYFIFNSGVVFELSRSQTTQFIDTPYSIALSSHRVDVTTTFNKQDTVAADWLLSQAGEDTALYVDYHSKKLLGDQTELRKSERLVYIARADEITPPGYIYFRTWNTRKKALTFSTTYGARQSVSFDELPRFTAALEQSDKIYDNGNAQVFLYRQDEK